MILICIVDCLQPCNVVDYKYSLHGLPMDFDEYLRILYEVSLKPSLILCHYNFFNNDLCLVTKKVQQQNTYGFRFFIQFAWDLGIFFIQLFGLHFFLPHPKKKKKKKIYLVVEGNQVQIRISNKLHCQQKKAKIFKFLQHYQIACMGSLMVILSKFVIVLLTYVVTLDNIICIEN